MSTVTTPTDSSAVRLLLAAAVCLATACNDDPSVAAPGDVPVAGAAAGAVGTNTGGVSMPFTPPDPTAAGAGVPTVPSSGGGGTGSPPAAAGGSGGSEAAPTGGTGAGSPDAGGPDNASPDAGSDAGNGGDTDDAGADAGNGNGDAGGGGNPPTPTDHPMLGVYVGNDPSGVGRFESWLGKQVDGVLGYTGDASWEDYDGSVGWAIGNWRDLDRRILWSVPLIPRGANLEAAAAGQYNDHYKKAAEQLAKYRPQEPELHIRTGWEFNGDWFPWAAKGKAQAFAGAFRQFVTTFRSVSDRFVFEWNVNVGDVGMNPEDAYPGDDHVDIIGMDFYWNTQWDPADANAAWDSMVNRKWGLKWHQDFAKAHGKPTSYSEWGVMANNAGPYIQKAHDWFEQHDVVFHTYWDSNNAFRGQLSNNQYPNAASAYKSAFAQ